VAATPEDVELVRRCSEGDAEAWRTLLARFGALVAHAVRNTLLRVLKNADSSQVDDAIQAVWTSLCADGYRRLRGFQARSALSTWLTVCSTRKALDFVRTEIRKGSLRQARLDDEDRDLVKELRAPEGEEQYSLDEIFQLHEALEKLDPDDKLVLKLYYLDGLSYRSIAEVLGVAANTVSSCLLRARDRLKKCIKERTGGVS
jgi:RNA polymerase sigma-70 factor (ECF subfamily)